MLIEKEDAIKAICEACYMYKYIGEHYRDCKYYPCDDAVALEAIPEAQKPSGDLISRADAIEAVESNSYGMGSRASVKALEALPSADAVSREKYDTVCEEYNRLVHNAICIKLCDENCKYEKGNTCYHAREHYAIDSVLSAESEQVASKLKNPCDSLLTEDSEERKELKSKLDLISRELAMERIANDNVSGGLERIHEYNNSTEFNDYLDGISDAITTIFCDVPSADITETEACQKCQEATERVLNRQGDEIKRLKASAEAVQGEWVIRENGNKECSLCGHERQDGWDYFCGYCGARMTKGGEQNDD